MSTPQTFEVSVDREIIDEVWYQLIQTHYLEQIIPGIKSSICTRVDHQSTNQSAPPPKNQDEYNLSISLNNLATQVFYQESHETEGHA